MKIYIALILALLLLLPSGAKAQVVDIDLTLIDSETHTMGDTLAISSWSLEGNGQRYIAVLGSTTPFLSLYTFDLTIGLTLVATATTELASSPTTLVSWVSETDPEDRIFFLGLDFAPYGRILKWDESAQVFSTLHNLSFLTDPIADVVTWNTNSARAIFAIDDDSVTSNGEETNYLISYNESANTTTLEASYNNPNPLGGIPSVEIARIPDHHTSNRWFTTNGENILLLIGATAAPETFWYDIFTDEFISVNDGLIARGWEVAYLDNEKAELSNEFLYINGISVEVVTTRFNEDFTNFDQSATTTRELLKNRNVAAAIPSFNAAINWYDNELGRIVVTAPATGAGDLLTISTLNNFTWNIRDTASAADTCCTNELASWQDTRSDSGDRFIATATDTIVFIYGTGETLDESLVPNINGNLIVLYSSLGTDLVGGAGLVLILMFAALYLMTKSVPVAGFSAGAVFVFFLMLGHIPAWVVIPILFIGVFNMYVRYRGAWE